MSRKAKFTDAGEGLILKYILDCRVASAPRNDTQIVGLSTNPNISPPPRNNAKPVVLPTNQNTFTPAMTLNL